METREAPGDRVSSNASTSSPSVHKMSLHESLKYGAEAVKNTAENFVREYKSTSEIPKRKRGEKSRSIDPSAFAAKGRPVPKIVIDGTFFFFLAFLSFPSHQLESMQSREDRKDVHNSSPHGNTASSGRSTGNRVDQDREGTNTNDCMTCWSFVYMYQSAYIVASYIMLPIERDEITLEELVRNRPELMKENYEVCEILLLFPMLYYKMTTRFFVHSFSSDRFWAILALLRKVPSCPVVFHNLMFVEFFRKVISEKILTFYLATGD
jgi:hypothetical protein